MFVSTVYRILALLFLAAAISASGIRRFAYLPDQIGNTDAKNDSDQYCLPHLFRFEEITIQQRYPFPTFEA
jgi:hypothetical protein